MIPMHARKVLYNSPAGNMAVYARHLISLKSVLAFQTLTMATLGKWATTHQRIVFLGKNSL